jgi:hypothetical protein
MRIDDVVADLKVTRRNDDFEVVLLEGVCGLVGS